MIRRSILKYFLILMASLPFSSLFSKRYLSDEEHLAFTITQEIKESLLELFSTSNIEFNHLNVALPSIAEYYKVVPIKVSTEIEDIDKIAVYISRSKKPLALLYEDMNLKRNNVSARIKVLSSSPVVVVASTKSGKLYGAVQLVKIPGGCSATPGVGYEN